MATYIDKFVRCSIWRKTSTPPSLSHAKHMLVHARVTDVVSGGFRQEIGVARAKPDKPSRVDHVTQLFLSCARATERTGDPCVPESRWPANWLNACVAGAREHVRMLLAVGAVHALSAGTVSCSTKNDSDAIIFFFQTSWAFPIETREPRSSICNAAHASRPIRSFAKIAYIFSHRYPRQAPHTSTPTTSLSFTNEKTMSLLPPRNRGMYGGFASYSSDDSAESEREIRSWRDPVPAPSNGRAYAICLVALPYSYSYSYYVWILPILADRPVAVGCS